MNEPRPRPRFDPIGTVIATWNERSSLEGSATSMLVADPSKELRSFQVAMTVPMGSKRGRGRGSFIDSVLSAIDAFYGDVVEHLKAWAAAPPRLRSEADALATEEGQVAPALVSTALSSQDGGVLGGVPAAGPASTAEPDGTPAIEPTD